MAVSADRRRLHAHAQTNDHDASPVRGLWQVLGQPRGGRVSFRRKYSPQHYRVPANWEATTERTRTHARAPKEKPSTSRQITVFSITGFICCSTPAS